VTHHEGYVVVVMAAILFGLGTVLNKIILNDIHPLVLGGVLYLLSGIFLILIHSVLSINPRYHGLIAPVSSKITLPKEDIKFFIPVVISGVVLGPFFYLYGLSESTAVNAALLLNTETLFTVLIAVTFFKEEVKMKDYVAIIIILISTIVLTANLQEINISSGATFHGNLLILLGCFFWAIDNNLSKILSQQGDIIHIVSLKSILGGTIVLIVSYVLGFSFNFGVIILFYSLVVGFLSIGLSLILFMLGLKLIGTTRVSATFATASLFGAGFAFIILKESLSIIQISAGFVMLFGVYLLSKKNLNL
jgi:drug/metabolite transporter (DMT)-like permease